MSDIFSTHGPCTVRVITNHLDTARRLITRHARGIFQPLLLLPTLTHALSVCIRHLSLPKYGLATHPLVDMAEIHRCSSFLFYRQYHPSYRVETEESVYRSKCKSIPRTGISCTWCFLSFCSRNCKSTFLR